MKARIGYAVILLCVLALAWGGPGMASQPLEATRIQTAQMGQGFSTHGHETPIPVELPRWDKRRAGFPASRADPVRRLTTNPADDIQPAWSPDGTTIVFVSNRINSVDGHDLFAINPDGTGEQLLAKFIVTDPWHGRFGFPNWLSNTGDLILMDYKYFHEVMRFQLSQAQHILPVSRDVWDGDSPYFVRLLFVPGGQGAHPTVSRDGSKIAWAALVDNWAYVPPENRRWQVRIYEGSLSDFIGNTDMAGTLIFQTEPGGLIETWSRVVAFSPDGKKLAFAACFAGWWTQGRRRDLYVANLTSGEVQRVTMLGDQGQDIGSVAWSPSNDTIAISMRMDDSSSYDLYLLRLDGSGLTRLTDTPWNEIDPCWSPNGSAIVFASDKEGNYDLYLIVHSYLRQFLKLAAPYKRRFPSP